MEGDPDFYQGKPTGTAERNKANDRSETAGLPVMFNVMVFKISYNAAQYNIYVTCLVRITVYFKLLNSYKVKSVR